MLEQVLEAIRCVRDVIGRDIGDEFKPLYEEYRRKVEAIVQSDLMKCRDADENTEFVTTFYL